MTDRQKKVLKNQGLVYILVKRYCKRKDDFLDLVQEGNLGLLIAVDKFDPSRNVKFSTYAKYWIRHYIFKYILDNWTVFRLGTTNNNRKMFFNLYKELNQTFLERIDIIKLAKKFNTTNYEIAFMINRSLYYELWDNLDILEGDSIDIEYEQLLKWFRNKTKDFGNNLTGIKKDIFKNRIISNTKPISLRKLGSKYNLSHESIRRIENRIRNGFKKYIKTQITEDEINLYNFLKEKEDGYKRTNGSNRRIEKSI